MAVIANLRILLFHVVIMISFYTAKSIFPTTLSPHYDDHRLSFLRIRKNNKEAPPPFFGFPTFLDFFSCFMKG